MSNTITIAGKEQQIASLRPLQVAEFFDGIEVNKIREESKVEFFTRCLRVIYQGLKNAENPLVADLDEEAGVLAVNGVASYDEVSPAYRAVLALTGLNLGFNLPQRNAVDETESSTIDAAA
jgi:hypothetical protein